MSEIKFYLDLLGDRFLGVLDLFLDRDFDFERDRRFARDLDLDLRRDRDLERDLELEEEVDKLEVELKIGSYFASSD